MKNREAAQLFRKRQREDLEQLQSERENLLEENYNFKEEIQKINIKNEEIQKELIFVRSFVDQAMTIAMANLSKFDSKSLVDL